MRFFTSDLHLGHELMAQLRGFDSLEEHDAAIIDRLNSVLIKKSKLWVLGDVAMNARALPMVADLKSRVKVLVPGNHDRLKAVEYLKYFDDVQGVARYKDFLLTHVPIHPREMMFRANIHGHVHAVGRSGNPTEWGYFNVGVEWNRYFPVPFETLENIYGERRER